jgi:anti-anti-sigma factor
MAFAVLVEARAFVSITTQINQAGSVPVISVEGKLVLGEAANMFREAVDQLLKAGNQSIVLNFAGVTFADSAGLGALAVNFSNVKAAGGRLAMAETPPSVRALMDLTKLSSLIPLFASEQEAVSSLS